jgi:hypothetical protein
MNWDWKYPDEVDFFEIDWRPELGGGETVISVTATAAGNVGLTVDNIQTQDGVTVVTLSGGSPGFQGRIEFLATLSNGRKLGWNEPLVIRPR